MGIEMPDGGIVFTSMTLDREPGEKIADAELRARDDPEFAIALAAEIELINECIREHKLQVAEERRQEREEAKEKERTLKHERQHFRVSDDGEGDYDRSGFKLD